MPGYYVHVDPAPPIDRQLQIAERDLRNLTSACAEIERTFGQIKYEMVILDDFTVYVWVRDARFSVELYNSFPDEDYLFKMYIDSPEVEASERDCQTIAELVEILRQTIGV